MGPVSPIQGLSHPSQAPTCDARQADPFTADPNIPAPVFADPSVPDPVPGESLPPSPVITDSHNTSGLSLVPPVVRRATDHDPPPMSSGISGLFTPAQRSEGGTPIQLEDESADALTIPQNGTDQGLEGASNPSPIERFVTRDEYGGEVDHKDAMGINELIELRLAPSDEDQLRAGPVDVGVHNPGVNAAESADAASPQTDHRLATPTRSQSHKGFSSDALSLKESAVHVGVLERDGERILGIPTIAEGDEDADGEADPDYPSTLGTNTLHPRRAHQPIGEDREVVSSKRSNDILGPKEIAPESENLPMK